MDRFSDKPTKSEIDEKVRGDSQNMEIKGEDLEKAAQDCETLIRTIQSLDFRGTAEGAEQVEKHMDAAENTAENTFDSEDQEMEKIQEGVQEHEKDLNERQDTTDSDLGKVSEASAKIELQAANEFLTDAKDSLLQDIDYMKEKITEMIQAKDKSEAIQEKLREKVLSEKRS